MTKNVEVRSNIQSGAVEWVGSCRVAAQRGRKQVKYFYSLQSDALFNFIVSINLMAGQILHSEFAPSRDGRGVQEAQSTRYQLKRIVDFGFRRDH